MGRGSCSGNYNYLFITNDSDKDETHVGGFAVNSYLLLTRPILMK